MTIIEEIAAREKAATKGPWTANGISIDCSQGEYRQHCFTLYGYATKSDAEFIAHAREDIPYLLDKVARLTAELEKKQTPLPIDKSTGTQVAWTTNWYACPHCGVEEVSSTFKFCPNCSQPLE